MNAMGKHKSKMGYLAGAALVLLPGSAGFGAAINGFKSVPRFFNGWPGSTLTITNPDTNPEAGSIHESNYGTGSGVNRNDIQASTDGGANATQFSIDTDYTISATFTLSDLDNSPRKEAGIRINTPFGGDALFIVNSDAGEIVAFGGGAPFHLFGNNAGGNGYVPGTPITLTEQYVHGPGGTTMANPGIVTYTVNYPTRSMNNVQYTQAWSNNEGGPQGFVMALYDQGAPGVDAGDFENLDFSNLQATAVPEPASLGVMVLSGLVLLPRRRGRVD
jgi:hypothetical protein